MTAMPKQQKTQACPSCGGTMRFERRDDVLVYRDHEKRIKTQGWWCTSCEEAILDGKALRARERAFLELKAEVDEVLGPQQVAKVRERLGLSQRKAGELLGGGPRAFQKYESGKQAVSVPMSNLLQLLDNDPRRLREIAADDSAARTRPQDRRSHRQGQTRRQAKAG
jgi:HTH-type transcriptional regulator / antitoxin MqsA